MKYIKLLFLSLLMAAGYSVGNTTDTAQAATASGITKAPTSQVISYYNTENADTFVQVTNTSFSTAAVIHIQILDEDCDELNFFDDLTKADTTTYHINSIVGSGTRGMVIINVTAAVNDLVPIEFPFLIGSAWVNESGVGRHFNSIGRNLTGGGAVATYNLIQPQNINASFHHFDGLESEFISLAWADEYNGGLGYEALSGSAVTTGVPVGLFIIDAAEGKDSCGDFAVECISELGVTAGLSSFLGIEGIVDAGFVCDKSVEIDGLVELIDLDSVDNYVALIGMGDGGGNGGLDYAVSVTTDVVLAPVPVCGDDENATPGACFVGADSICVGNPLCGGLGESPLGQNTCNDGDDNDGDGVADCLDIKCDTIVVFNPDTFDPDNPGDGIAVCEFGTELNCADSFDNDGDGLIDCLDTADCPEGIDACPAPGTGGGGSSGCSVATATTGLGSMANALVLLIPAFGIGVRRIRRRLSK